MSTVNVELPTRKFTVFLSYSPRNKKLRVDLEESLNTLEKQGVISIWHDEKIRAGNNRNIEINKNLNSACIILLLITRHFLNSEYHRNFEIKQAMEKQNAGKAHVIPVLLSPIAGWQSIRFGDLQLGDLQYLPKNGKFITDSRFWKNQNEAFVQIAEEFAEAVQQIAAESH
ncbi:toll/interleukin-1 receptor domain-containing protein [Nostoc sp.]|uniref:toll/interleukin-1 receptor domain-containing protein n=1 Tax=Nostoc sp. TaxID=1180 RepID=UPI002FF55D5F